MVMIFNYIILVKFSDFNLFRNLLKSLLKTTKCNTNCVAYYWKYFKFNNNIDSVCMIMEDIAIGLHRKNVDHEEPH